MNVNPLRPTPRARRRACAGFTMAEVLAAMLFMGIVIPVALEGLRLAARAGAVASRKAVAARVAESVLNELLVTSQWQTGAQRGSVLDGTLEYPWEMRLETWDVGTLRLLTVWVAYPVQGQDYEVRLSTLVDITAQ